MEAGDDDEVAADGAEVLMRRASLHTGTGAFAAALLIAGLASGCGAAGGASLDEVAHAATTTSERGTLRSSMTMAMTLPGSSQRLSFTGRGAYDTRARLSRTTLDLSSLSQAAGVGPGTMEIVTNGTVMYLRMGAFRKVLPAGKTWVRLDLQQVGRTVGVDMSALMQLGTGNSPLTWLQNARAAGKLDRLGSATVRGVETMHYRLLVDLRK